MWAHTQYTAVVHVGTQYLDKLGSGEGRSADVLLLHGRCEGVVLKEYGHYRVRLRGLQGFCCLISACLCEVGAGVFSPFMSLLSTGGADEKPTWLGLVRVVAPVPPVPMGIKEVVEAGPVCKSRRGTMGTIAGWASCLKPRDC